MDEDRKGQVREEGVLQSTFVVIFGHRQSIHGCPGQGLGPRLLNQFGIVENLHSKVLYRTAACDAHVYAGCRRIDT